MGLGGTGVGGADGNVPQWYVIGLCDWAVQRRIELAFG